MIPAFPIHQPLALEVRQEQRTEILFSEKDIREGFIEVNPKMLEYFKNEQERKRDDNTDLLLTSKLKILYSKWKEETMFSSSVTEMVNNFHFKEIISFGRAIVPSLLREIEKRPSELIWALNLILNRNISDHPISFEEASKRWVNWGRKNNLI